MKLAVLLLGPPASGKSTLTRQLAGQHDMHTFRLREYARQRAKAEPALAAAMNDGADPLGWLPDRVATSLVRDAVTGLLGPSGRASSVVFEGYPGNAYQATHLARLLDGLPTVALVLRVNETTTRQRAQGRRVCPACTTEDGEPHRPARIHRLGVCADCGSPVRRRSSDVPARFALRTERFLQHLPSIRAALTAQGVPWRSIDAGQSPAQVLAAAQIHLKGDS
ncbi:nucleoside monophosphate kinase [Kitasatospora purpeofusca]|uniref:nucleoside monophosphate kinase n=1 Tax=Kitasatospora purpeofusca TaxID=67352 RepID=UPI0035DDB1CA